MGHLKPYEDEQIPVSMNNLLIERIPMIVDPSTGNVTSEFQKFYDEIVRCILSEDVDKLYCISDRVITCEEFVSLYNKQIGDALHELLKREQCFDYNIDIELNLQRFKENTRNILGGFIISTIEVASSSSEIIKSQNRYIRRGCAEIFFTYRYDRFQLISSFSPFILETI